MERRNMIGFIIFVLGIFSFVRINFDKFTKPSLSGEYEREAVNLDKTRDDLKTILSSKIATHNSRVEKIKELRSAICDEEKKIEYLKTNKAKLYKEYKSSIFKAFSKNYPQTTYALRITKYIACSIPLLLALQHIDVNILGNSVGFVKFALFIMTALLCIAPIGLLCCFFDESQETKIPNNRKEFVVIECYKHSSYIKQINKQIEFEIESLLDLKEKIKAIEDELASRNVKISTAVIQGHKTTNTSNAAEENKKKLAVAIEYTDYITGKLKRARSTQSILKLTDEAREQIASNAIVLKASQAKMQKVDLEAANEQLKSLLNIIEQRLLKQMQEK